MYCKNCGAPAGFDILRQTYACASCGETTGIKEIKEEVVQWKTLQMCEIWRHQRGNATRQARAIFDVLCTLPSSIFSCILTKQENLV